MLRTFFCLGRLALPVCLLAQDYKRPSNHAGVWRVDFRTSDKSTLAFATDRLRKSLTASGWPEGCQY